MVKGLAWTQRRPVRSFKCQLRPRYVPGVGHVAPGNLETRLLWRGIQSRVFFSRPENARWGMKGSSPFGKENGVVLVRLQVHESID